MISFNSIKQTVLHLFFAAFCLFTSLSSHAQAVVTFFHNDASGTPMVATDAAGNVVWKESYKPYGEKLRNEPASRDGKNKIGYAGSPFDASTGLSYMGARYYDPVIGRFMGIDPVGFQENNIHSFNRYAYANNNPYKYIDRNGRSAEHVLNGSELSGLTGQMIGADPSTRTGTQAIGAKWQSEALNQASALSLATSAGEGVMVFSGVRLAAREVAKSQFFSLGKAPALREVFGWGKDLKGVVEARAALTAEKATEITKTIGRTGVEDTRKFYQAAANDGRGLPVSTERAGYMTDILNASK
jgi:RHS repeat-associated protein